MKNHPQILIAALVLKLLSWFAPTTAAPLLCLESSNECIEQLTEAAIANSAELDAIDQRLRVAAEQQQLLSERANQHRSRGWTTWLTMEPVALIGNLFGGGPASELELKVEELELRGMSVEAQAATLEVRRGEVEDRLREEVLILVLGYEEAARRIAAGRSRIETEEASYHIFLNKLPLLVAFSAIGWAIWNPSVARRVLLRSPRRERAVDVANNVFLGNGGQLCTVKPGSVYDGDTL